MTNIYEVDTWRGNDELNKVAIEAAKKYDGRKFTVAIGEWGTKTFLVFADSKDEARERALASYNGGANNAAKVKVREVTNCKKYQ